MFDKLKRKVETRKLAQLELTNKKELNQFQETVEGFGETLEKINEHMFLLSQITDNLRTVVSGEMTKVFADITSELKNTTIGLRKEFSEVKDLFEQREKENKERFA